MFRGGEGALQCLPPLIDVIPEARLNLVIYYLKQGMYPTPPTPLSFKDVTFEVIMIKRDAIKDGFGRKCGSIFIYFSICCGPLLELPQ